MVVLGIIPLFDNRNRILTQDAAPTCFKSDSFRFLLVYFMYCLNINTLIKYTVEIIKPNEIFTRLKIDGTRFAYQEGEIRKANPSKDELASLCDVYLCRLWLVTARIAPQLQD